MSSRHSSASSRKRRVRRLHRVPPPITQGSERLEASELLLESPGELGILLWKSVRSVTLWSSFPSNKRSDLFCSGAYERRVSALQSVRQEEGLYEPLERLASILARPEQEATGIANTCGQISQWAEAKGKLATALEFAQAAALACPCDAGRAYAVARFARRRTDYGRAETWYRQALMLARQSSDWTTYAFSYLALGKVYLQRGRFPAARRIIARALNAAERHRLHDVEGMAYHDLAEIAIRSGRHAEAERYAIAALTAYGPGHRRLPALAHDIAYSWMTQGLFSMALQVFQVLRPEISRRIDQVSLFSSIVRAAGGAVRPEIFEEAWTEVEQRLNHPDTAEGAAMALLELARGATSLCEWERAEQAASRALELAVQRGEAEVRIGAEALLESVRNNRAAHLQRNASEVQTPRQVETLAERLINALRDPAAAAR